MIHDDLHTAEEMDIYVRSGGEHKHCPRHACKFCLRVNPRSVALSTFNYDICMSCLEAAGFTE